MEKIIKDISTRIGGAKKDLSNLLVTIETLTEPEFDSKNYLNDGSILYHTITTVLGEEGEGPSSDFSIYCAFYEDLVFIIHSLDQGIVKFKKVLSDEFDKSDIFGFSASEVN